MPFARHPERSALLAFRIVLRNEGCAFRTKLEKKTDSFPQNYAGRKHRAHQSKYDRGSE